CAARHIDRRQPDRSAPGRDDIVSGRHPEIVQRLESRQHRHRRPCDSDSSGHELGGNSGQSLLRWNRPVGAAGALEQNCGGHGTHANRLRRLPRGRGCEAAVSHPDDLDRWTKHLYAERGAGQRHHRCGEVLAACSIQTSLAVIRFPFPSSARRGICSASKRFFFIGPQTTCAIVRAMWQQNYTPIASSLALSALVAAVPIFVLLYLIGIRRKPAWIASLSGLGATVILAAVVYGMPAGMLFSSVLFGAAFGL